MNELRMYVEHLFEGKVLTSENIELKEEIYGNLVARYEDYLSEGMSEAEALAKTKESMTSIEDVLAAEAADAALGEAADAAADNGAADGAAAPESLASANQEGVEAGDAAETVQMPRPEGAPVPPLGVDAEGAASAQGTVAGDTAAAGSGATSAKPRKKWPFVVAGVVVAVLVLSIVGVFAFNYLDEADLDEVSTSEQIVAAGGTSVGAASNTTDDANNATTDNAATNANGTGTGNGAANGAGNGSSTSGAQSDGAQYQHYLDPEDQYEYEMTSQLATEIQNCDAGELQKFASGSTSFGQVAKSLPLGSYVESTGQQANGATLNIRYSQVHDAYDGDMVDRALVYNAVSLMALYPDVQTVNIALHEQGDHTHDADYFSFQRRRLENGLSNVSGNAITQINSSLFESTDAWDQVCTYILSEHFCDNQVDVAEVDD